MMLHPNAAPLVLRQIEQKQNMNGTGVSDSTENVSLPHWHEPSSVFLFLAIDLGMATIVPPFARWANS